MYITINLTFVKTIIDALVSAYITVARIPSTVAAWIQARAAAIKAAAGNISAGIHTVIKNAAERITHKNELKQIRAELAELKTNAKQADYNADILKGRLDHLYNVYSEYTIDNADIIETIKSRLTGLEDLTEKIIDGDKIHDTLLAVAALADRVKALETAPATAPETVKAETEKPAKTAERKPTPKNKVAAARRLVSGSDRAGDVTIDGKKYLCGLYALTEINADIDVGILYPADEPAWKAEERATKLEGLVKYHNKDIANADENTLIEESLPTLAEFKQIRTERKADAKANGHKYGGNYCIYSITPADGIERAFNIDFMIDLLTLNGDGKYYTWKKQKSGYNHLSQLIKHDNGHVSLLMGVRPAAKQENKAA